MNLIRRGIRFIKYNEHKSLTLLAWIYSAVFRLQILYMDTKRLKCRWGAEGEESPKEADVPQYLYAKKSPMLWIRSVKKQNGRVNVWCGH